MTALGTAALRRQKKKKQREQRLLQTEIPAQGLTSERSISDLKNVHLDERDDSLKVQIEYVEGRPGTTAAGTELPSEFAQVFEKFQFPRSTEEDKRKEETGALTIEDLQEELGGPMSSESAVNTISKKKLKKMLQIGLAALKQYAQRPEIVEWEDVTAKDPKFLVQLKGVKNSVPVPRHWNRKRKYLAGKRGFVKPPFELPAYIRATGVGELREAMRETDATKSVKIRAREKMHPKMGRMSLDYELLHDAFFLHQTKPPLSKHGDLYYEGREQENRLRDKRPGYLSEELRLALGMTTSVIPPPWLFSMQKYGPPPSYPHLRIPGLNCPIPEGAQWGFHPGGWGKPPVNDPNAINFTGKLAAIQERTCPALLVPIDRNIWGEFEPEAETENGDEEALHNTQPEDSFE